MRKDKLNLLGEHFGSWEVIASAPSKTGRTYWKCRCVCGSENDIPTHHLRGGHSTNCGCVATERKRQRTIERNTTHGLKGTYLYSLWQNMKDRCLNSKSRCYPDYGGRGIAVHNEWVNDAGAFVSYVLAELGHRPSPDYTFDRINNDGNYEPGNVRWADAITQANNRRPKKKDYQ